MRSTIFTLTLLFLAGFVCSPAPASAEGNVLLKSIAEIEVKETDQDGNEILVRKPATKVLPDTVVIYTNTFSNIGQDAAADIQINNPIPEHTNYVAGSAFGKGTDITFSVDGGKSFAKPEDLTVPGPDGQPQPAAAEDYTHIRWTRKAPLQPGEEAQAGFRVQLE